MSVEIDVTSVRLGGNSAAASAKQAWLTVALLFLFMLVNFADELN